MAHIFPVACGAGGVSCRNEVRGVFLLLLLFVWGRIHISHIRHMGCFENTGLPGVTMINLRNIIGRARFVTVKANKHC